MYLFEKVLNRAIPIAFMADILGIGTYVYYLLRVRPHEKAPSIGFLYKLSNHGSEVFITLTDASVLSILGFTAVILVVVGSRIRPGNGASATR